MMYLCIIICLILYETRKLSIHFLIHFDVHYPIFIYSLKTKRFRDRDFYFHVGHACVGGKMATEKDVDELFEIKTALYTGNYQHCINECHKLRVRHCLITYLF